LKPPQQHDNALKHLFAFLQSARIKHNVET